MNTPLTLPVGFTLRLATADDERFLRTLFCSARPELALLPLPPTQLELLLGQQYELQQKGYFSQFPGANTWIIETYSGPVGKITLQKSAHAVRLIDFIVAPDWRRRGVGSAILNALKQDVAARAGELRLSVDRQNTGAKRLYAKHGFVVSELSNTHEQLVWSLSSQ